jgi:hypothetical protein
VSRAGAVRPMTLGLALGVSACVPADDASGLGSVEFYIGASDITAGRESDLGAPPYALSDDGWRIQFERVLLGFKTMTIGKIGFADVCSYRGRGALSDVVFDPRVGIQQTFNGIQPVECPDVGIILGAPGPQTTFAGGATAGDVFDLAAGRAAHAIVEASARYVGGGPPRAPVRIQLRFDSERTTRRFAGCREETRGVTVLPSQRDSAIVRFSAELLFRDALSPTARLIMAPFLQADASGDRDGVITMDELDALPLVFVETETGPRYRLPNGAREGFFGDWLRALFRFAFKFRSAFGTCTGTEPGIE